MTDGRSQLVQSQLPTEPDHWGLPVLGATPGSLIRRAQQVHWSLWARHVHTDITSVQYGILLVVAQRPGVDQRTVGDRMSLDKANATDVIGRLIRRGLLSRKRDAYDGRRKLVWLTPAGYELLVQLAPGAVLVQDRILEPLSPAEGETMIDNLRLVAYRGDPPDLEQRAEHNVSVDGRPLPLSDVRPHMLPGHLIRRAQQVHTTLWAEHIPADLTSVQYNILLVLHHKPRVDQRLLGRHASLDKSTLGEVTARMVRRGLIARESDRVDARRNVLELTVEGRRLLFERAAAVVEVQRALLAPLSADVQEDFLSLLARIATPVDRGRDPALVRVTDRPS